MPFPSLAQEGTCLAQVPPAPFPVPSLPTRTHVLGALPRLGSRGRRQPTPSGFCSQTTATILGSGVLYCRGIAPRMGLPLLSGPLFMVNQCVREDSWAISPEGGSEKESNKPTYKLGNLSSLPDEQRKVGSRSQTAWTWVLVLSLLLILSDWISHSPSL